MEDKEIYNAIIISLVIGIIIVTVTLVVARPEPESFTELYFNNHQDLPKYNQDAYEFSFSIHNLENKDINYKYQILVDDKIVLFDTIEVKDKEEAVIPVSIEINKDFERARIQVLLPEKDQEIHFWVQDVGCLKSYEPGIIEINARRTYCCGEYAKLEVKVNNEKIQEITLRDEYVVYVLSPELKSNDVVDLVFTNDNSLKDENGKLIEDRNVFIDWVKVGNKKIKLLYDRNELDCKDLKDNGNMYWNGGIRFRMR